VLAGLLAAVSLAQVLIFPITARPAGVAIALVSTLPIAFRRPHPIAAALVGLSPWLFPTEDGYLIVGYVTIFLLFYSLAVQVDDLRPVVAVPLLAFGLSAVVLVRNEEAIGEWLGVLFAVSVPIAVGRLVRRERARTHQVAVAEERARIARELHDVVAHGVSVIAVQADAAEAALQHDPARAEAPLRTIRGTATGALGEMRRMLDVLRPGDEGTEHAPQPGLAQLPALLEHARAAGLHVGAARAGNARPLPPSLDLTAYRIVQEALTNVRKHAPGSPATAQVTWGREELSLEIRDRGPGRSNGTDSGGHGLVGMEERVRIHGGRLRTGAAPGGGFEVVVTLPVP
jgi:signal transduction histidine kinase